MTAQNDNAPQAAESVNLAWLLLSFDGRIDRELYWLGIGFVWSGLIAMTGALTTIVGEAGAGMSALALVPVVLWTELALVSKRLHDRNLSGFWALLIFVPLVGVLWTVMVGVVLGDTGPNSHGSPNSRSRPPVGPARENGGD